LETEFVPHPDSLDDPMTQAIGNSLGSEATRSRVHMQHTLTVEPKMMTSTRPNSDGSRVKACKVTLLLHTTATK